VDVGLRWSAGTGVSDEQRDIVITRLMTPLEEAVLSINLEPERLVVYLSTEQQDGQHFPWTVVATNFRFKPELHSLWSKTLFYLVFASFNCS
jgi:hypothetical protein